MNGIEALEILKKQAPDTLVIMLTAAAEIEAVVASMRLGAYDYVVKPVNMDALKNTIHNALQTIRLRKEVQRMQRKILLENIPFFVGASRNIQKVMSLVKKVAQSPETSVLIVGETGTGKELIASTIHYRSPNFRGPFVTLNCSALPDNLIESELFGYEKGAFSGADPQGKKGLLEAAAGGTLFLDEVGDLSPSAQAKLLRFLESGEFYRLGGVHKYTVNVRVVAATNKNIEDLIQKGLYRKDLYFRLATIRVELPNLNSRPEDIVPIAKHYLVKYAEKLKKHFSSLSTEAESRLKTHNWTGNIRELRNVIERAVLLGDGPEVTAEDLGFPSNDRHIYDLALNTASTVESGNNFPPMPVEGFDLPALHRAMDIHYYRQSLDIARGNVTRAAELLNTSYFSFRRRKDKLGL
jgi:DNA-binding NtrC family response regulator